MQTHLFGRNRHLDLEWMRGLHSAEEINTLVAVALEMPYEQVWDIFVTDCQSMHVSGIVEQLPQDSDKG